MKTISLRAYSVFLAFGLLAFAVSGPVSAAAYDDASGYGYSSKKKEPIKERGEWARVIKSPLLIIPPPPRQKDQPKKETPKDLPK